MSELEQKNASVDTDNSAKTPPWSQEPSEERWEFDILNRLAFATLNEQRRARRWGIFFKLLLFIYLITFLFLLNPKWSQFMGDLEGEVSDSEYTALIELQGVIASDTEANATTIISGLRRAFKDENAKGIILRINSPGGSPVQAGQINDEIKRLREKHPEKPLYVVVTDLCASGGYYIAAAADKIYADKASLVGSIGVLMNGFGFVEALEKLGIERRLMTAGEYKGALDPFSPMQEEVVAHIQKLLDGIHAQFINVVKEGRKRSFRFSPEQLTTAESEENEEDEAVKDEKKDKKEADKDKQVQEKLIAEKDKLLENELLFSGMIWTGEEAVKLGLVDELASASHVAREVVGAEKLKDFTPKPNYLDRFAERLGSTAADTLAQRLGQTQLQ